ncbi:MAG: glycosyltransferase family 39 protein [Bacteroidales bacterium]|nr:glycosyltransferase family 39 protein [Bacteroidales bacterium]
MPENIKKYLAWLIILSTVVRAFIAGFIELGNDEVYYWTYALYPDWSHFDHPPMVGFIIQLFSLDLLLKDEFFIRLGSIIFGAVNTWLIYLIGAKIKDSLTGFYAALLYTTSIYCFIITGIFILPDTPQVLFWLISLYLIVCSLPDTEISSKSKQNLLFFGLVIGFGMLSKYTSVFLWVGSFLYILLYNRNWLKTKELYISGFITIICFLPVILWNINNDFISFTYHSERVDIFNSGIRFDYFFTEVLGQFFYNNPVNVLLILAAVIALIKHKEFLHLSYIRLLLWMSVPLIFTFLTFSLFRRTLPHWTGPAYIGLILIAAAYLRDSLSSKRFILIPNWAKSAIFFLMIVLVLGIGEIRFGWINLAKYGDDISVEMFGWDQAGKQFARIYNDDIQEKQMKDNTVIIANKWFPAAHIDYYIATPLGIDLFAYNSISEIHKYAWINKNRGGAPIGCDAYFITTSLHFKDPNELYQNNFETIATPDTITIYRATRPAKEVYIYRMYNLIEPPAFDLPGDLR